MTSLPILFVLSSHSTFKDGKTPTGWYLPEAAHPYYVLTEAGYKVDFASPAGGAAPLDPASVEMFKDDESVKFLNGEAEKKLVQNTLKLKDVKQEDYAAIFYVGGHGPCFDLAVDPTSIALIEKFFAAGKPTAAVCHGPVVFHKVKDQSGNSIVSGRKVTCFSDQEEEMAGKTDTIPFLVESDLRKSGADFQLNRKPWEEEVVVDTNGGILITGGNPASAKATGEAILKALKGL